MLTQSRLKELLDYDSAIGIFVWRISPARCVHIGDVAGHKNPYGYLTIKIKRKLYRAHRLAWLYVYGKLPEFDIDHINHNRADNRIINLRDVTNSVNQQNQIRAKGKNPSGLLGVVVCGKVFRANIGLDGKLIRLGAFKTAKEAHEAYLTAKRKLHIGCTL